MKPNRLIHEKSPYLLQHAHNPVDWFPWGDEAFEKGEMEDKPIFLSIGYSTCHWCHVMAHESFEDPEAARLLNDTFICVKVDREERPDIDKIYMTACQMLTGSGGWPLTIFMTPDREPFYAATYIPKESRHGVMGLMDLIPRIRSLWEKKRSDIIRAADELTAAIMKNTATPHGKGALSSRLPDQAYRVLAASYDTDFGGFGSPPKFPIHHQLLFLLRYGAGMNEEKATAMAIKTLTAMRSGGIYDHLGYGFHRYSTDRHWLIPHFEKMLYDQALLAMAYLEACAATGDMAFETTAREIFTYVLRDMTDGEGGFYSAEDADSEGVEGRFYVWTEKDIRAILSADEAEAMIRVFAVEQEGNYQDEATQKRTGNNILHIKAPLEVTASGLGLSQDALQEKIKAASRNLFLAREKRIHPHKDDKILTDWNGLMIAALARGAQVLGDRTYLERAEAAVDFIWKNLRDNGGRLLHRFRDGETAGPAHLDDYAFFIWGLLECYGASFNPTYLERAISMQQQQDAHFTDGEEGGYFFTPDDGERLIARQKEGYDGAIPSGNAVSLLNLIRLGRLTGDQAWEARANSLGAAFAGAITRMPSGFTMFMTALLWLYHHSVEIVIAGEPASPDTQKMLDIIRHVYLPHKTVILRPPAAVASAITDLAPFTRDMTMKDGKATAYVCSERTCLAPTNDLAVLTELLKRPAGKTGKML
ncbi:MAG: hypothetical protein CSYNP_03223 [Syntrophus sp. SKADARSKE-3]|nr:hypothetical protein [Syntrophus sp. SKADARSKE-3]